MSGRVCNRGWLLWAPWLVSLLVVTLALLPGPAAAQDLDDLDDLAGDDEASASDGLDSDSDEEEPEEDDDSASAEAQAEGEVEVDGEGATAELEALTEADMASPGGATEGRGLSVRFGGGLGAGTLSYERLRGVTRDVLDTTPVALAEALVALHFWPDDRLSLVVAVGYQTSIGLRLAIQPQFALPERLDARLQRTQLEVGPVMRLGDGPVSLGLPLGFALQTLTTEVHQYDVPGFVLAGASLGLDLHYAPSDWLSLSLGPTSAWLFIIGTELPDDGVCCQGLALGGRASLDLHVSRVLRASFAYQETHTAVPMFGSEFQNITRMLTARLLGEM